VDCARVQAVFGVSFEAEAQSIQPVRTANGMTRGSLEILKMGRLIHDPTRLLILTFLYPLAKRDYLWLQKNLKLTAGNLSSHLARLEKAGYVAIEKGFKGKYAITVCGMTKKGRETLEAYAQMLNRAMGDVGRSNEPKT
jgi:DNA-binding transcriptional ArsR family regulator